VHPHRLLMAVVMTSLGLTVSMKGGPTLFGVRSQVNGGSDGCGSSWNYDTWSGGSGGQSTSPSDSAIANCTNTFSGSSATGLTAASSQASQSSTVPGGAMQSVSQSSSMNLANLSLHGDTNSVDGITYGGFSTSELWDTLTFNISGATGSTVTNIPFVFSGDGVVTGPSVSEDAALQLSAGGVACFEGAADNPTVGCSFGGLAGWDWDGSTDETSVNNTAGFITYTIVSENQQGFVIDGVVSLTGADPVLGVAMELALEAGGDTNINFTNTAALNFNLPNGVSFTSASGVDSQGGPMATGVPEPSTFALLGVSLLGLGILKRRAIHL
jgi:PEP-CTERM motif-containing protein